jgi:hypothetical protein
VQQFFDRHFAEQRAQPWAERVLREAAERGSTGKPVLDDRLQHADPARESFEQRVLRQAADRAADRRPAERLQRVDTLSPIPNPTEAASRARGDRTPRAVPYRCRRPGGAARAGQRSRERCSPAPTMPVVPELVLMVLRRRWKVSRWGYPSQWRVRALAALAVALAVPPSTTCGAFCEMLPGDLARLRWPRAGWRWVRLWLSIRSHRFTPVQDAATPWLAFGKESRGKPRQIGWAIEQALHRGGAPAWRLGALLRASWLDCRPVARCSF